MRSNVYSLKKLLYIWMLLLSVFTTVVQAGIPELTLKAHNGVLQFDGILDNKITLPEISALNTASTFTLESWVRVDASTGSSQYFFSKQINSDNNLNFLITSTGEISVVIANGGYGVAESTQTVNDGAWHHIAVVYNGNGATVSDQVKFYVDGIFSAISASYDIPSTTANLTGTSTYIGSSIIANEIEMSLDEFRIWDSNRTQVDINATMNQQLDGNETGLVLYYNFDERTGDKVVDITANGNDAIIEGNVTRLNFLGDELSFDGNTSFIDLGDTIKGNSEFSTQTWVYLESNSTINSILTKDNVHNLKIDTDRKVYFQVSGGTSWDGVNCASTSTLSLNKWYNIATTFNDINDESKIYINGELDSTCTTTITMGTTTGSTIVGGNIAIDRFDGYIKELSGWNTTLSLSQIQENMNSSLKGDETGLVGYWPLNEGTGITAKDYSTNSNNGTITSAIWIDTAPTIYGDKLYTDYSINSWQKLIVENNTTTPIDFNNSVVNPNVSYLDPTTGLFLYSSNSGDETLSVTETAHTLSLSLKTKSLRTVYEGTISADTLTGTASDEVFIGLDGNDTIDGGDGNDTAVFSGDRVAYTLTDNNDSTYTIVGPDGTDILTNIENLKFDNIGMQLVDFIPEIITLYLNSSFSFDGNLSLLDGMSLNAYLGKTVDNNFIHLGNVDGINTDSSTSSYTYNKSFTIYHPDQYMTIRLSKDIDVSSNIETVLYKGIANTNLTLSGTNLTISSLIIPVDDIGNIREITFYTSEENYAGHIHIENNTSHESGIYQVPMVDGNYTISASYMDGSISYYNQTTSSWGNDTPNIIAILGDTTLNSVPTDYIITSGVPSISNIYDRYKTVDFTSFDIVFDVNDTDTTSLNLSVSTSTDTIVGITQSTTSPTANSSVTLTVNYISGLRGNTVVTLTLSDGGNTVEKNFNIEVASRYQVITVKESTTITGIPYTGDLYTLNSFIDENSSQFIQYEKLEVIDSSHSTYTEIKNINGLVNVEQEINTKPDTAQFEDLNISNSALSTLYTVNGTPFTFTNTDSLGLKLYITYPTQNLDIRETINNLNGTSYGSLSDFMTDMVASKTTHGILRNNAGDKLLVLDESELSNTYGSLIEMNEDGTTTGLSGSWSLITIDSKEMLLLDTSSLTGYKEDAAFIFDTTDNNVKFVEYKADGDVYSYILLNKSAKDELYYSLSPNPKIAVPVVNGYNYVSLSNTKTLCDSALQSTNTALCDENNTLESVFGSTTLLKNEGDWIYWDANTTINAAYLMNKFSTLSSLDGAIVKATENTTLYLPYDNDIDVLNDYDGMMSEKWYLLSNKKDQTISEIVASATLKSKKIEYILILRDNVWNIYAPLNNTSIDPAIPRITEIKMGESYWIIFQ